MSFPLYNECREVLNELVKNPTRSLQLIAKEINSYRQKVWRQKTKLEEDKVIWGYTAVVDETKLGNLSYVMLIKFKPLDNKMADLIMRRANDYKPNNFEGDIRILCSVYINGDFDWMVLFTASNHESARRYYNEIYSEYKEWITERPRVMDVNYFLIKEGKINPDRSKLIEYVPI